MQGIVAEGNEILDEDFEGALMDAGIVSAAQRVEHYEMAGYGTACAFAEELGESDHVSLLKETLEEEKETDEKLSTLSKQINPLANQSEEASKQPASQSGKNKSRRVA